MSIIDIERKMKYLAENHLRLQDIEMVTDIDHITNSLMVSMRKINSRGIVYNIRQTISSFEFEDGHADAIVMSMARTLKKNVEDSEMTNQWNIGGGGGGAIDAVYVPSTQSTVNVTVQGGGGGGGSGLSYGSTIKISSPEEYLEQKKHFNDEDMMAISKFKEDSKAIISSIYSSLPLSGYIDPMNGITPALVIAGGVYTSLYHKEFIKDCDVFFLDFPLTQKKVMEAIDHEMASSPSRFVESDLNYLANAGNKLIKRVVLDNNTRIQYIFTTYANRQELLDHFDAEHACISYHNDKLYVSPLTFDCIKNKTLKSHKGNTIALWRVDKFKKRGFKFASIRI
jgi:hypothetical protein